MNTEQLLDHIRGAVFRYFWNYDYHASGLARDRDSSGEVVMGGSGFVIMAILKGMGRAVVGRQEGL